MTPLDLARISAHLTAVTGHKAGTFEHESMLGRVLGELTMTGVSSIRPDDRGFTVLLTREEFERTTNPTIFADNPAAFPAEIAAIRAVGGAK